MRQIIQTKQFKSDFKKIARSGRYQADEILTVIQLLAEGKTLAEKYRDHTLTGEWQHHRECHIRPDWLLIYKIEDSHHVTLLKLVRTGSHSELFGR